MKSMTSVLSPERPSASLLGAVLRGVAVRCVAEVPAATGCGLLLLTGDGRRITSVATDPVAERLNVLHDSHRENPCRAAWSRLDAVEAGQAMESAPWPSWMTCARELGAQSVLTAALCTRDRSLGAVMIYSTLPRAFRLADREALERTARSAAVAIDDLQSRRTPGTAGGGSAE